MTTPNAKRSTSAPGRWVAAAASVCGSAPAVSTVIYICAAWIVPDLREILVSAGLVFIPGVSLFIGLLSYRATRPGRQPPS